MKESWPPQSVTVISAIRLDRNARAPHRGRRILTGWISEDDQLLADVLQVASELLTNAVIHPAAGLGRESIVLQASRGELFLLVEVIDPGTLNGSSLPEPKPAAFTSEMGRGLGIVADYAAAWGTYTTEAGHRNVWAVLGVDPAAVDDTSADCRN